MNKKVLLTCLQKGCPRKRKIDWEEDIFPIGTVEVKAYCDWHEEESNGYEEYYDKRGNEIFWMPDDFKDEDELEREKQVIAEQEEELIRSKSVQLF